MRGNELDDYYGRGGTTVGTDTSSTTAANSAATTAHSRGRNTYAGIADIDIHARAVERYDWFSNEDGDASSTRASTDADT